ncbi:MAG: hypothetical protein BWY71_01803 [Planctomycetes bacterium ADurb.Bin412]|nr:MAG: hypothetical protein BWY71_01803 [Planctomycetes bacterium ADurb.Bin412]
MPLALDGDSFGTPPVRSDKFIRQPEGLLFLMVDGLHPVRQEQMAVLSLPASIMFQPDWLKLKNQIVPKRPEHAQIFIRTGHIVADGPQHRKNTRLFAPLLLRKVAWHRQHLSGDCLIPNLALRHMRMPGHRLPQHAQQQDPAPVQRPQLKVPAQRHHLQRRVHKPDIPPAVPARIIIIAGQNAPFGLIDMFINMTHCLGNRQGLFVANDCNSAFGYKCLFHTIFLQKKTAAKFLFDRGRLTCVYTWRLSAEPAVLISTPPPVIFLFCQHYKLQSLLRIVNHIFSDASIPISDFFITFPKNSGKTNGPDQTAGGLKSNILQIRRLYGPSPAGL